MFIPKDDEHFTANVKVIVSNQFISWVFSLGNGVKIVGPDDVVEKVKSEVERLGNNIVIKTGKEQFQSLSNMLKYLIGVI